MITKDSNKAKGKTIVLDKISDFDEVIKFYQRALNFSKTRLRNNINIEELKDEAKEPTQEELISFFRAKVSSETLRIIQIEEQFHGVNVINNEIDDFFRGNSILKSFTVPEKQVNSENYKIRQLRNCLVHSMYEIRISKDGENAYLYLNNGSIKGAIKFEDFAEIADKYTDWYNNFCQYENVGILSYDAKSLEIPDKKKAINKFVRSFKISNQELSDKRIATLKKWIDRMGIDTFRVTGKTKEERESQSLAIKTIISDMINSTAETKEDKRVYEPIKVKGDSQLFGFLLIQLQLYFNNSEMKSYIEDEDIKSKEQNTYSEQKTELQNMLNSKGQEIQKDNNPKIQMTEEEFSESLNSQEYRNAIKATLNLLSAKKPYVYSDTIMSLSYYIFNYIREIDRGRQEQFCDYINIEPTGFKTIYQEEGREHVRKRNLPEEYDKETNPKKKEQIKMLMSKYGNEVIDSSNFFSHIRNSIAHGWYKIDYSKYYNTRNLDEIMFSFPTYYPKSRERDFEVQVSAKNLLNIIGKISEKINENINLSLDGKTLETEVLREALVNQKVKTSDLQKGKQKTQGNKEKAKTSQKPDSSKSTRTSLQNIDSKPNKNSSLQLNSSDDGR